MPRLVVIEHVCRGARTLALMSRTQDSDAPPPVCVQAVDRITPPSWQFATWGISRLPNWNDVFPPSGM
jgi:hypothetical protein